jgi:hypothetical protein
MPTFTFTSPEGKSYDVEGPAGATQEQAWAILQQHLGSQPQQQAPAQAAPPQPANLAGVAARALMQGTGALLDTPAALAHVAEVAGKAVANPIRAAFGAAPTPPASPMFTPAMNAATSMADSAGLSTPQTPGQRILSAAIGSLPSAAVMGPEAIAPVVTGSAAAQGVHESGGDNFGAFLASLLAGGGAGALQGGLRGAIESQATSPAPGSKEAAVAALRAEGVPVNVAQATGNKIARHIDRASQMVTKGAEEFSQDQLTKFNGAALRRIGVPDAEAATPDVLQNAKTTIGTGMDEIEERSGASFDTELAGRLQAVKRNLLRTTPESERAPLLQNIQDMIESAGQNGGTIPGATVRNIRGNLADLQKNPALSPAASDAQEALQDAVTRNSDPADVSAYADLRRQYRALKQIQGSVDPKTGNIIPTRLMTVLMQQKNQNQTLYGQGDQSLVELARNAARVLPDTLGNSGTPERFIPTLTLMEDLQSGSPLRAAAKTVLGLTGVAGAARALRNPGVVDFLTSQQLSDTLRGGAAGTLSGGTYGVAGDAAQDFLSQLDQVERARQESQRGRGAIPKASVTGNSTL